MSFKTFLIVIKDSQPPSPSPFLQQESWDYVPETSMCPSAACVQPWTESKQPRGHHTSALTSHPSQSETKGMHVDPFESFH